tara:strand:- start:1427 stop:1738 length:312 start_codon:yes stop_codon:yes gene_type:complete
MKDNINNLGRRAQFKTQGGAKPDIASQTDSAKDANEASAAVSDHGGVHLSSDALKLKGLKKAILSAPDIDEAKVERLKGEIARGDYKVGFEKIAQRMIDGFVK